MKSPKFDGIHFDCLLFFRAIGLGAWGLKIFYAATSDRNLFKVANLIVYAIGALNYLWIVYDITERQGLNEFKQFIAWISLSMHSKFEPITSLCAKCVLLFSFS